VDEQEFRKHADGALEALRRRLLALSDEFEFEVEGEGEKLELEFDDADATRFVISPNTAARQIWISALSTSFKLAWSEAAGAFVMEKTGETLGAVMSRILTQQIGSAVTV